MKNYKRIVVTGSIAFDHIMTMPGRFKDHIMPDKIHVLNVSFLMDKFRREYGGTGANVCYSLALMNTPCLLVASAGNDLGDYLEHLKQFPEIDLEALKVVKDESTANAFAMTDLDDNQIWAFYQGAMQKAREINLSYFLKDGDYILIGPNDPEAMKKYVDEAIESGTPYMFDPAFAIPHFMDDELDKAIKHADILIGNDYEMELMSRSVDVDQAKVKVTTRGGEGSLIERGSEKVEVPIEPVEIADPTGAGDAYRAGFLAAYIQGKSLEECGKKAAYVAAKAVASPGTQNHRL